MNVFVGSLLLLLVIGPACTTPPQIKQAVVAKDVAYAENARLMTIHRELLESIDTRYWYWYRYAKKLALLDQAMKWATTDPDPPSGQSKENHASLVVFSLLGMKPADPAKPDTLLTAINRMRLRDLPERKGKDGSVLFDKGRSDMNTLIQGVPELIDAIQKKVEAEFSEDVKAADYSAFDDYQTNLAALRRINGMIKRYLDIDVTVKHEDIGQSVESVNALR